MFVRGILGYLPSNILQAVVGVATIWVFTHLLTAEQFGIYALSFAVLTLAHVSLFSWIEAAMERHWAEADRDGGHGALYATLYKTALLISVLFVPVVIGTYLFLPASAEIRIAVCIGLIGVPVRCCMNLVKVALRARGDVRRAANLDMFFVVAGFAIGIVAALSGAGGSAPLIGLLIAPLLLLPVVLPAELKRARGGVLNADRLKAFAAYGYPISISLGMGLILATTDRFMLEWLMGEAAVGAYHASYSLASRTLDVMFIWLGTAGAPALVMALERGSRDALKEAATDQVRALILLTIPAAVGLALVARPLAEVVIGPQLRSASAMVTPWIAASALLSGFLYYYFNQAFTLAKRTRLLLVTMLIPAVVNIGGNLVLIPRFGLSGAAAASVAGYGVGVIASIFVGRRTLLMPVPMRDLTLCLACSAAMAAVVLMLPSFGGIGEVMLDASVGALVYAALVYATNAGNARQLLARIRGEARGVEAAL